MNGQSKVAELISAVSSAGFFKRIFSWKSIKEKAVLARMEAENAESMHAAEIREITFRLSEAEKRARDAEQARLESLREADIRYSNETARSARLSEDLTTAREMLAAETAAKQALSMRLSDVDSAKRELASEYAALKADAENLETDAQNYRDSLALETAERMTALSRIEELTAEVEKTSSELRLVRDTLAAESEGRKLSAEKYAALKEEYDSMSLAFVEMRETRAVEAEQCRTALENAEELTLKYEKAASELQSVRDMLTAESEGRKIETQKYAELKAEFDEKSIELSSVKELLAAEESVKEERTAEYERRVEKLNTLVEQMEADHAKAEERILSEVAEREERLSTAWQRHEKDVSESMKSIAKKHDFIRCDKDEYPNPGTPDNVFLIGGMYTVFDAKSPKNPEELSNFPQYLKAQAEGMKKYCKHENVRKDAFLVVPASTLEVLTTFMYDLAEYTVYVITPESMLPILQMLRTIENYDFAEQLSPEDRDKLCRFIGRLSHTTKRKVQIDTYFSRELVSVLREIDTLPDEFANDIAVYEQKAKLNPPMEKRAKMISVADVSADVSRIENEILGWSVVEE
ncbi:MAG: hypothetical protein IIX51_03900 [Methanocorpusculum sp.]|jgi:myosin heavy subunit|nr:hypothetical protein [Methanocorpusculum sp.]HJJ62246.1 hypothetical protein [Methanocorpusculum sp.]HJJ67499.1 hypothetical protein [Methanocorpusculum sp.]HJJ73775.1 hypothetical protein [Methanocorpusculum sp.]